MAHDITCDFDICGRDHGLATTYMVYRLVGRENYFHVHICDRCAESTKNADDVVVIWAQSMDYLFSELVGR